MPEVLQAGRELKIREGFNLENKKLNTQLSAKSPLVLLPEAQIEILDMMPRLDIIED